MEQIQINDVSITIERKKIKHMYLRILPPNAEVKISAPLNLSKSDIIKFANSKYLWIKKKQEIVLENSKKAKSRQLKYLNGETHYLWGKPYTLQLIEKNKDFKNVFTHEDTIYLPINVKNTSFEKREKSLLEFYRKEIKLAIPPILKKVTPIVGVEPKEWRVKNMKTRWGTCNPHAKRIWLNLQLAKKSPQCLEYVTIHELTHFYVHNHGEEFKDYMNKFYPDWPEVKNLLKEQQYY